MWIWQHVLEELWELWGTCDKLFPDRTKISSLQLLDTWFDKEKEAEYHSHPISAFQGQSKTAEMLSASVALTVKGNVVPFSHNNN